MNSRTQTQRDPVCGMTVSDSAHTTVYHAVTFHFCSAQCLAHFLEAPALYAGAVRREDVKAMPKSHVLRISTGAALDEACRRLRAMMGVTSVQAEANRLHVDYDLRQVSLSQLEAEIQAAGIVLKGGLHALRRSLWRFTEHNELQNAARSGPQACCNRPPTPR
ncbi:MAG: YHS domain-containing protein [Proteobacteria bacterium]|nr:YHS domain-containing protein [Pseudomonadota bacterium]